MKKLLETVCSIDDNVFIVIFFHSTLTVLLGPSKRYAMVGGICLRTAILTLRGKAGESFKKGQ